MVDGSVGGPPQDHPLANFQSLWLAGQTLDGTISLDDWVKDNSDPDEDLILQMDIEGSEYEVILSTSSTTIQRFRIIVLELHDLRSALSRTGLILFTLLMAKLGESHTIVHAHPNNCCLGVKNSGLVWPDVLELTLVNKSRITSAFGPAVLPHALDRDNTENPPLHLKSPF